MSEERIPDKYLAWEDTHSSLPPPLSSLSSSGDVVRPAGVVCPPLPAQPLPGLPAPQEGLPGHRLQPADCPPPPPLWPHHPGLHVPGHVPTVRRGVPDVPQSRAGVPFPGPSALQSPLLPQ